MIVTKKPLRRQKKTDKSKRQKRGKRKRPAPPRGKRTSGPWLSRQTGLKAIGALSLGLAAFVTWQLYPSEGLAGSMVWGLGFGAALWLVFFGSLAFNTWIRGNRE